MTIIFNTKFVSFLHQVIDTWFSIKEILIQQAKKTSSNQNVSEFSDIRRSKEMFFVAALTAL